MTTMAIDHQQRFGGGLNFDHMPYTSTPQFTNPWTSSGPQSHSLYASSQIDLKQQQQQQQPQQAPPRMHGSVGSYASVPLPASSSGRCLHVTNIKTKTSFASTYMLTPAPRSPPEPANSLGLWRRSCLLERAVAGSQQLPTSVHAVRLHGLCPSSRAVELLDPGAATAA